MVGSSIQALPGGLQRIESPKNGRGSFGGAGWLPTDRSSFRRTPLYFIVTDPGALEFKGHCGGGESTGLRLDGARHQYHCRLSKLPQQPGKRFWACSKTGTLRKVQQAWIPAKK